MNYSIEPSQLYQLINTDGCFIDIRDTYQYNNLHLKNFENIPEDHFSFYMNSLPKDKPIYLICYSGKRANRIVTQLRQMDYNAYYVEGGFQAFLNLSQTQYF